MRIGIGITTRNRHEIFFECLSNILENCTYDPIVVVTDDASDHPVVDSRCQIIRSEIQLGVAKSKNICLRNLSDCDHIFLFDDDCWPIQKGWERAYIDSARETQYEALCYTWVSDPYHALSPVQNSAYLKFHDHPCGVMMYLTRKCVDTIGGFCEDYGVYGGEHADYFVRARNTGLIRRNYPDILESEKFFRALDREPGHVSISAIEREKLEDSKLPGSHSSRVEILFEQRYNSTEKWEL